MDARGRLRVNAPRPALPSPINRLLPYFEAAHFHIQLLLVGEGYRPIDIVADGYDAGIRLGDFVEMDGVSVSSDAGRAVCRGGNAAASSRRRAGLDGPRDLHCFRCVPHLTR